MRPLSHYHIIRGTHGLKANRLNHANQLFGQIDQVNQPYSHLARHDLHSH